MAAKFKFSTLKKQQADPVEGRQESERQEMADKLHLLMRKKFSESNLLLKPKLRKTT